MELFVGEKIFGITVFVMGFITTFIVGLIAGDVFLIHNESSSLWVSFIIFMIFFISLIAAFFVSKIRKLGIIICGVCAGIFVGILLNQLILWRVSA